MEKIYLVTGAAGFLGGEIVAQLAAGGKKVRALVMQGDRAAERLPASVERFVGDVCRPSECESFFETNGAPAVVIHAAGIVSIATKTDPRVQAVNVCGTANIISLCFKHKVQKLVYVSSVHAIPELPNGETIRETSVFSPELVVGQYAKSKAAATALVLDAAARGLNASVVHPSGIIGPGDPGHGYIAQLMTDYYNGTLTAGVLGGYDFADVRDVAAGVIRCCEKGKRGECYILSNRYVSVPELLATMSAVTGRRRIHTMLPLWFARASAPLAELYYKLLRQPPLYTAYSMYTLQANANFSHEKATRELDFHPRDIRETLADTVAWLCQTGRLQLQT